MEAKRPGGPSGREQSVRVDVSRIAAAAARAALDDGEPRRRKRSGLGTLAAGAALAVAARVAMSKAPGLPHIRDLAQMPDQLRDRLADSGWLSDEGEDVGDQELEEEPEGEGDVDDDELEEEPEGEGDLDDEEPEQEPEGEEDVDDEELEEEPEGEEDTDDEELDEEPAAEVDDEFEEDIDDEEREPRARGRRGRR